MTKNLLKDLSKNNTKNQSLNYLILFIILLAAGLTLRLLFLRADIIYSFSPFKSAWRDEGIYTLTTKLKVLFGSWNLVKEDFYSVALSFNVAVYTLSQYLFSKIFGFGLYQTRFISVMYSIFAIILLALIIKKEFGWKVALFSLLLMCFNYYTLVFNRLASIYNTAIFYLIASSFFYLYSPIKKFKQLNFLISGVLAGFAFFSTPMTGFFLIVIFIHWLIFFIKQRTKDNFIKILFFGSGVLLTCVIWLLIIPNKSKTIEFLLMQLFGRTTSKGFSFYFIQPINIALFFFRMPILSLLTSFSVMVFIYKSKKLKSFPQSYWFFLIWFLINILWYSIQIYQGLRIYSLVYQAMVFLSAYSLSLLFQIKKIKFKFKKINLIFLIIFSWITIFSFLRGIIYLTAIRNKIIFSILHYFSINIHNFYKTLSQGLLGISIKYTIIILILFTLLIYILKLTKRHIQISAHFKYFLIFSLIAFSIISNMLPYIHWSKNKKYRTLESNREIKSTISTNALLISGTFIWSITQDTKFKTSNCQHASISVYHTIRYPFTNAFKKYPHSHFLLVDSIVKDFYKEMPEYITKNIKYIATFVVRETFGHLYLFTKATNHGYTLTDFEKGALLDLEKKYAEAIKKYKQHLSLHPDHAECYYRLAINYLRTQGNKNIDKAIKYLEKTIYLLPRSYLGHKNLGVLYFYNKQQNKALSYWKKALILNNKDKELKSWIDMIINNKASQRPPYLQLGSIIL